MNNIEFIYTLIFLELIIFLSIQFSGRVVKIVFGINAVIIMALCFLKIYGSAPDDYNYLDIFRRECINTECESNFLSSRDLFWFYSVDLFKVLGLPTAIKLIATIALAIKLWVVYKLSHNKIFGLAAYFVINYFIHDLIQYRVGLAEMFLFLSVYFIARNKKFYSTASLFATPFCHLQALPSPLLLLYKKVSIKFIGILISVLMLFTLLGLYPNAFFLKEIIASIWEGAITPTSDIGKYIYLSEIDIYDNYSSLALSVIVLGFSLIYIFYRPLINPKFINSNVIRFSLFSCFSAFIACYFFASIPDMQNRFFEFFIAPIVFIFGNLKKSTESLLILMFTLVSLWIKYHFLQSFFMHI